MTTTIHANTRAIDAFIFPSLAKLSNWIAMPVAKCTAPRQTAGLSFTDISDASLRATAKLGLQVKHISTRKIDD